MQRYLINKHIWKMSALGYFKCTYSREKILLFADAPLNSWTDTIRWCVKSNTSEHCYEIS